MPKKSQKSQKGKQKKPSLSTHKQTGEKKTVAPIQSSVVSHQSSVDNEQLSVETKQLKSDSKKLFTDDCLLMTEHKPKEINEIVALKKASEPPQSQAVETSKDVGQEARQLVSPQKIDLAESTKEVTATKPDSVQLQPVAEVQHQESDADKQLPVTSYQLPVENKQLESDSRLLTTGRQGRAGGEDQSLMSEEVTGHCSLLTEKEPESTAIFQAVGIIRGEVDFPEDGKTTVTIGRQKYPLFYTSRYRLAYSGLKKQIEATGNKTQRLIVYPKVTHFPKRDTPHFCAFQLVGFDTGKEPEGINSELKDNEFKLCGLWQFIPVCRTPCVSIFKNFNKERLNYIKEAEPETKVRFMKASHLPLLWRDSPVRPFRFNPKGGKDQGHPAFVSVKARFMPGRDCFGFVEMLAEPEEKAPRFLKVSKKDKETAMKNKKSKVAK